MASPDRPRPLVEVRGLRRVYGHGKRATTAVENVSFDIFPNETLGLVGESGSGKSTIGRAILMLPRPTSGSVRFDGSELTELSPDALRSARRQMQIVFQDPYSSLDPRMTVGTSIAEPLEIHGVLTRHERARHVAELLGKVGLDATVAKRFPHEFSGGQRQRIAIARAIALKPKMIVADEPISALDVSIQAQILNLMMDLQDELQLSYLLISHDLRVVQRICDRVAVLNRGRIVELAETPHLFANPLHPYTKRLLDAIPLLDPRAERARSDARAVRDHPTASIAGRLVEVEPGHFVEKYS